jgi:hypothetical protein
MIFFRPISVNNSNLTSTIPEPDASTPIPEVEWVAGTYELGDRVIKSSTNSVYEVVANPDTTDDPEEGVLKDPQTWVYVSPTNRFKMFDGANNTQTVGDNIVVSIVPNNLANSVACFNVSCESITVKAFDALDNEIYSKSINMRSRPSVTGWYNYFYGEFIITSRFTLLDIPPVTSGRIELTFTGTGATVGTCVLGKQVYMGEAQHGSGAELLDFSDIEEDTFGNVTFDGGFSARLINYDIIIDRSAIDFVFSEIRGLGKSPTVFIGDESLNSSTLSVFGFVRDFNTTYDWPTKSSASLTVRGLV